MNEHRRDQPPAQPEALTFRQRVGSLLMPPVLAVALGAISLPVTIATMSSVETVLPAEFVPGHLTSYEATIGSIGAVLAGALVGGSLGGLAVRRRPLVGALLALGAAWPAAVLGFTVLPALFDHPFSVGRACVESCSSALEVPGSLDLSSVFARYLSSIAAGVWFTWPLVGLLVLGSAIGPVVGRTRPRRGRCFSYAALALASLVAHGWSVQASGWSFIILAVGVGVWMTILDGRALRQPVPGPFVGPRQSSGSGDSTWGSEAA